MRTAEGCQSAQTMFRSVVALNNVYIQTKSHLKEGFKHGTLLTEPFVTSSLKTDLNILKSFCFVSIMKNFGSEDVFALFYEWTQKI